MTVSRRTALRVRTAAALGAVAASGSGIAAATPSRQLPDPSAWRELRRLLSPAALLVRPGDPDYATRAAADNQRYASVRPAGVLACATEGDVAVALRWCAKHGVPFAPRSGGHNYAGYSTTTGLVISLRGMNQVAPQRNRLHLGGGATNSDVYAARAAGLYFPGGRCPGVGVAGLTLGGGLGFNDRNSRRSPGSERALQKWPPTPCDEWWPVPVYELPVRGVGGGGGGKTAEFGNTERHTAWSV